MVWELLRGSYPDGPQWFEICGGAMLSLSSLLCFKVRWVASAA